MIGGMAVTQPAKAIEFEGTGLSLSLIPAVSSDYLFRGVSQTRNRPAVQGTVELSHESGFYIGAFASNISFLGTKARQELDIAGGYRMQLGAASLDFGGVWYTYPGYDKPPGGYDLNYFEFVAKGSYQIEPVKLLGAFYYSPQFQLESRNAFYLEGGADVTLPYDFTLSGRLGYQWIDRNDRYGLPNFANWSVAVSRELFWGVTLSVGYYDTNISKSDCAGGQKICDARAMAYLSRTF
ncbi:TorF family putative porin [Roseomonas sp. OT10]|uniref:TorF family putative porin n=1 Tax=Roseomonas cutis TaxID=2897332 RepID=UPI001E4F7E4B|nr:TorF family putative porin [Roseomonas sp. OT10]UFN47170.1 TorF family putative porin [Roseomonas sp. OT10]